MHTPRHDRPDTAARESRLIRDNLFGLIISTGDDGAPAATHVPMLRSPEDGASTPDDSTVLVGTKIIGHMARVNPQWRSFAGAPDVLAVFSGPDGYVSPTVYQTTPAAPTWNYAGVHVTGPVRLIDDPEESLDVVLSTIHASEAHMASPWDFSTSMDYFRRILPGIMAFEITVKTVDSRFKLSQEKPAEIQHRVHDSFAASPHGRDRELAALMADVLGLQSR
ncbi:FMN-binding negative transcriptional regulator [Phytoactinopolyspora endophytica]|uniref:FMN-binding negative transcriptional regulator n=1 Tax=Phytoactinopolyspora endophytica TaxID=1642495 RepID=UPI00101D3822|nr:FMN-binding negative transcriptional regulator [Phytoactinopolyspora endophytica]